MSRAVGKETQWYAMHNHGEGKHAHPVRNCHEGDHEGVQIFDSWQEASAQWKGAIRPDVTVDRTGGAGITEVFGEGSK